VSQIGEVIGVSVYQMKRFLKKNGLSMRGKYSNETEENVDRLVHQYINENPLLGILFLLHAAKHGSFKIYLLQVKMQSCIG
jgi:hypothetical protein